LDKLGAKYSFSKEKVANILLLANLARLLVTLIELTDEFSETTAEERHLQITQIALQFPNRFLPPSGRKGTSEAKVLMELRTQIFVQLFLQTRDQNGWDEWNTSIKLEEIFQTGVDTQGKGGDLNNQRVPYCGSVIDVDEASLPRTRKATNG